MSIACPICGNRRWREVYRAARQPAMLNRQHATACEARNAPAVDLQFVRCDDRERCGFVWNALFQDASVQYTPGYVNDQSHSPAFRQHLDKVRRRAESMIESHPGAILEIGCGQGGFLRSLCNAIDRPGIGFDPAFDASVHRAAADERTTIHARVFDVPAAAAASQAYALVCCRHVLEHIAAPSRLVREIASLLARQAAPGRLYVEVPCFEWIAGNAAFFDLFNEHCSLFTPRSLRRLLVDAGFADVTIDRVFGGQYLAAAASLAPIAGRAGDVSPDAGAGRLVADTLGSAAEAVRDEIESALASQTVVLWGAGAKGVSLVNHLRLDASQVPFIIDINPAKQGRFVPITAQEVVDPEALRRCNGRRPPVVYVMNPNYAAEVRRQLDACELACTVRVLDGRPRVALHR